MRNIGIHRQQDSIVRCEFPCSQSKGFWENAISWERLTTELFAFFGSVSFGCLTLLPMSLPSTQSNVHAESKGSADAGGISSYVMPA